MSPSDPESVPVDVLRAAVREARGRRSLRQVAEEIGISHTGLRGFLDGARPHRHNRRKLASWLARTRRRQVREPEASYAAPPGKHTFDLLLALVRSFAARAGLGPEGADRAAGEVASLIRRCYAEAGREPPDWMGADTGSPSDDGG